MSRNKSTRTKCEKKIKVQGPQNGFYQKKKKKEYDGFMEKVGQLAWSAQELKCP